MVVEVMKNGDESALIRPYYEHAKNIAFEQYDTLEDYSPLAFSVLQQTLTTVAENTPQFVQDKVTEYADTLDDYVDATDGLLMSAMDKTQEFPELLEKIKGKLTLEEFWILLAQVGDNSKEELAKYLPSAGLDDILMRDRVQEIVSKVLSQPQLFKDQATDFADNIVDRLDLNKDGKVSVGDIAGTVSDMSSGLTTYCSALLSAVLAPIPSSEEINSLMSTLLENPSIKPYVSTLTGKLGEFESCLDMFQPLWVATNILKAYVARYTTNVQEKISPLTPYLTSLIQETSVTELPFELLNLTKTTAGLSEGGSASGIASETRALLWALVDISFILEALKESSSGAGERTHGIQGVTTISDADALKDGSWAKGFRQLDFS